MVEVVSVFRTLDRRVDWQQPRPSAGLRRGDSVLDTADELQAADGIVRATATKIVRGEKTDIGTARALYRWVVANDHREPLTPGCGVGDIRAMLESGNLSGKCADLNALFVGLARSVAIPSGPAS